MEVKTTSTSTHRIGVARFEYLNLSNICYANAADPLDYRKAIGFMDAFEFTLEPGSEAKREIAKKKETIDTERKERIQKWEQWKQGLTYFEQYDVQNQRDMIEIEAVGKRLEACWDLSKRFGLLND